MLVDKVCNNIIDREKSLTLPYCEQNFYSDNPVVLNSPVIVDPILEVGNNGRETVAKSLNFIHPNSKAYTSAMIALQNKIKELINENQKLNSNLMNVQKELEKHKCTDKNINELEKNEKQLKEEIKNFTKEKYSLKQEKVELQSENIKLKDRIEELSHEKEKHLEQNAIDKDDWRKEKELLLNQLSENNDKVENLSKCKETMMTEIESSKTALMSIEKLFKKSEKESKKKIKDLTEENNEMKKQLIIITNKYNNEIDPLKEKLRSVFDELERLKHKSKANVNCEKRNAMSLKKTIEKQKKEIEILTNPQCKYAQPRAISSSFINQSRQSCSKECLWETGFKSVKYLVPFIPRALTARDDTNCEVLKNESNGISTLEPVSIIKENALKDNLNKAREEVKSEVIKLVPRMKLKHFKQYTYKEKPLVAKDTKPKLNLSDKIFFLEREIADLNYQHKELCSKDKNNESRNMDTVTKNCN